MQNNSKLITQNSKLNQGLGWKADENFESSIVKTVEWYLRKYK